MGTLHIKTVQGEQITVIGNVTNEIIDGEIVFYCNGERFPQSIVEFADYN